MTFRYLPQVVQEIEEAALYFEGQQPGLGERFLLDLEKTYEAMAAFPQSKAEVLPGIRRALLSRFPYNVFYEMNDETLTVIAVVHSARHERVWTGRL